jgi:hypothetical protein
MPEAEALLVRTVQAVCISVEHMDATLSSFDQECPTPREIKDTAHNLRPKFDPKIDQRKEWEKQYGPPGAFQPTVSAKPIAPRTSKEWEVCVRTARLQAIRDTLYYTEGRGVDELDDIQDKQERNADKAFWANALVHHEREHPEEVAAIRAGRDPEVAKEQPIASQRITPEMMRAVTPVRHERCPKCGGSGMLAFDEYCTCEMGESLRKLRLPPHSAA